MAWIALAVGFGMSIRAIILLVRPPSLSLDVDAFEIGHALRRVRVSWSSVGGFQVDRTGTRALTVMYEVLDSGRDTERSAQAIKYLLPDNYGLRREELAWLMNAWHERSRASLD